MSALSDARIVLAQVPAITHSADRLKMALAALVAEIDAAPVVKVRGKIGEFATIVVSHTLVGKTVRLLALDSGGAGEVGCDE